MRAYISYWNSLKHLPISTLCKYYLSYYHLFQPGVSNSNVQLQQQFFLSNAPLRVCFSRRDWHPVHEKRQFQKMHDAGGGSQSLDWWYRIQGSEKIQKGKENTLKFTLNSFPFVWKHNIRSEFFNHGSAKYLHKVGVD